MSDRRFIAPSQMVAEIGPVTKRELESLRAQQERPERTLDFTIGGTTEQIIHKFENERLAVRAAYVENRLDRVEGRATNDFALAKERGKAKHDFGRER